jgi:hypothetical protein
VATHNQLADQLATYVAGLTLPAVGAATRVVTSVFQPVVELENESRTTIDVYPVRAESSRFTRGEIQRIRVVRLLVRHKIADVTAAARRTAERAFLDLINSLEVQLWEYVATDRLISAVEVPVMNEPNMYLQEGVAACMIDATLTTHE